MVRHPPDPGGNGRSAGADLPLALSALIQEAIAAEHTEHDDSEIVGEPEAGALVDLSSMDAG